MVIRMLMPVTCPEMVPTLKAYANNKYPKLPNRPAPRIEVGSLYKKMNPKTLTRQNMVYIANTAPKMIAEGDIIYLMSVDNPILMGMICSRVTDRVNKLFTRSKRRWFLLEYDPKTKSFQEYFLP